MRTIAPAPGRYTRETFDPSRHDGLQRRPPEGCVIEIAADGAILDLSGVYLDGEGKGGVGVSVRDCRNVTIRNGVIRGFHYGIHAVNAVNLKVSDCVLTDNANRPNAGWLPDTEEPAEEGFGGGIYLCRASRSVIENNLVNNNFNGISLVRSDGNIVRDNQASCCGNVGVYLLMSSRNEILHNRAEHCIRYTERFWCDTADSAGILLEKNSNHNRIIGNSLRYGGDGFFIRANPNHSSDYNYIKGNDASFSPNNGFEAVYSAHNVFEENTANYCNYGFWLGYSSNTTVLNNEIRGNRLDGVAIDRGRGNRMEGNDITGNRNGVRLWGKPWRRGIWSAGAARQVVAGNKFSGSRERNIAIEDGLDAALEGNVFGDAGDGSGLDGNV